MAAPIRPFVLCRRRKIRGIRQSLTKAGWGTCYWCGQKVYEPSLVSKDEARAALGFASNQPGAKLARTNAVATIEHLVPKHATPNRKGQRPMLVLACRPCNHRRGARCCGPAPIPERTNAVLSGGVS